MAGKPRLIGVVGNVLLLLVMLALLGVGYGFTRLARSLGEGGWPIQMPSEATLELAGRQIQDQLFLQFLAPPAEDEPLQQVRVSTQQLTLDGLALPDSVRDRAERSLAFFDAYIDTAASEYKALDRIYLFDHGGQSHAFYARYMGETSGVRSFAVAHAPTEYVVDTMLPRAYDAFLHQTVSGRRFQRWITPDSVHWDAGPVTVRFNPTPSGMDEFVLEPFRELNWDDPLVRRDLTEGNVLVSGLGWLVLAGKPGSQLLTYTVRLMMVMGGVLWLIVFVGMLVMMSRIRRLSTTAGNASAG